MPAEKLSLKLEVRPTIRSRSPRELLIFGLDDTLIDTSLYWLSRSAVARAAAARSAQPGDNVVTMYDSWVPENQRTYEPCAMHASVTMQDTWLAFQKECAVSATASESETCLVVARSLRGKFPLPIPGAEDLLKWAQPRFTVALLTSGDPDLQKQKLEAVKIAGYFKAVKVVPAKRKEDYLALIAEMGFSPRNSWVFGDSVTHEINPALAAGANCILFSPPHPRRADAQQRPEEPSEPIFRIHALDDARAILAKPTPSLAA